MLRNLISAEVSTQDCESWNEIGNKSILIYQLRQHWKYQDSIPWNFQSFCLRNAVESNQRILEEGKNLLLTWKALTRMYWLMNGPLRNWNRKQIMWLRLCQSLKDFDFEWEKVINFLFSSLRNAASQNQYSSNDLKFHFHFCESRFVVEFSCKTTLRLGGARLISFTSSTFSREKCSKKWNENNFIKLSTFSLLLFSI